MTALATHIRPAPYTARTFAAFRIGENSRTTPVRLATTPTSLDEALTAALTGPTLLLHKEKLLIRETDEAGRATLHLYAIRQKARAVPVYRDFRTRMERPLFAEFLCSFPGEVCCG